MGLIIHRGGRVSGIYTESIPLRQIGRLSIERASHVEPTCEGTWQADLTPVDGPVLGPFQVRSEAISAELQWLRKHWVSSQCE
jgi:hypothetical protein